MKYRIHRINEQTAILSESKDGVHIFLLEGSEKALLVDTGTGAGNIKECARSLTDKPLVVLNTHGHYDHMGGNYLFEKVYLHPADREAAKAHQTPEYLSGLGKRLMPAGLYLLAKIFQPYLLHPRPFDHFIDLADGQIIALGDRDVEVIHTPGHTRGSVCLLDRRYNLLFTGDSICRMLVLLGCMDYCDTPEHYIRSLEKLKDRIDPKTVLYSNHHANPVPREYIDKYIACAKRIIETPEQGKTMKYGRALWNVMEYEDVRLTFDRQGKEEEDAG